MNFHGIDMKGDYKAQIVADASALGVPSPSDVRRIVYDETTKQLWFANSSAWTRYGTGDIPAGSEMWIYADTAPVGWLPNGTPSDELLAVEGGGTYTTGGPAGGSQGSFTLPDHSHSMGNHKHTAGGVALPNAPNLGQEHGDGASWQSEQTHAHPGFSVLSTIASPPSTTVDGGATGYRPLARVGLICSKN